jgi:ribonucleoside-diphosphate reductase alpha chain
MIAFESDEARTLNNKIFSTINRAATAESRRLADERGEAPDMVGTGMHNAHLLAIAPNASSSIAAGVDPSVEPRRTNAFKQSTQAGMALNKNPVLAKLLAEIGRDTPDVWKSIIDNQGSVQHLDFLTDHQRAVFKTAFEIDQQWIVEHAATRQPWICQGQSINLFFENPKNDADLRAINQVHLSAWKKGLKSLYYVRSRTAMRANTGSATRQSVAAPALDPDAVGCTACEG